MSDDLVKRLQEMVGLACDVLNIEGAEAIRFYDEADCDGGRVADDLESALETYTATMDARIEELVEAAVAAERERCAQIAESAGYAVGLSIDAIRKGTKDD